MSADIVPRPYGRAVAPDVLRREAQHRQGLVSMVRYLQGTGGYAGASGQKRALREWNPLARSSDDDTIGDLQTLRARSRDLERNSPIAGGAIDTNVVSVIGDELKLSAKVNRDVLGLDEDTSREWEKKAELIYRIVSRQLDVTGVQSLGEMEDLALRSQLVSGDMLVVRRWKRRPGDLLGLKLQFVEADRVSTPPELSADDQVIDGVRVDLDGAHMTYHVRNRHPHDWRTGKADVWSRVAARGAGSGDLQAFLLYDRKRPGQTRGVPYLAPVIEPLKQLERYTESELAAAVVSSFFTVFVKTSDAGGLADQVDVSAVDDGTINSRTRDMALGPAAMFDLEPGDDITTANPTRPNSQFDPFVVAIMQQIGMGLDIPYEVLAKHYKASYSAARAALLDAWRFFRRRRAWFARRFCDVVYEWVITESIMSGLLEAPQFFADPIAKRAWLGAIWTGPAPGSIDPKKEYEAYGVLDDRGWAADSEIVAEIRGRDYDEVAERIARDHRRRAELGISRAAIGVPDNAAEGGEGDSGQDEEEGEDES